MTTIGVFLFDDAEELDWAGPWEVLASWALGWPKDGATVLTVSQHPGPVTCAKGLRVLADHQWADCPDARRPGVPGRSRYPCPDGVPLTVEGGGSGESPC